MNRLDTDIVFGGEVKLVNAVIYNQAVGDTQVKSTDPITYGKIEHEHRAGYAQASAATAASEARVIHVVQGATATVLQVLAGVVVACIGDSTIAVDIKKNGVTILTAPISIDSGDVAYAVVPGTLDSAGLVVDDVLEVVIVATVGTGTLGTGLFVSVDLAEDAV